MEEQGLVLKLSCPVLSRSAPDNGGRRAGRCRLTQSSKPDDRGTRERQLAARLRKPEGLLGKGCGV